MVEIVRHEEDHPITRIEKSQDDIDECLICTSRDHDPVLRTSIPQFLGTPYVAQLMLCPELPLEHCKPPHISHSLGQLSPLALL